ncbi:hypothetical protein APHAL10511_005128 [Amanita phalloides]|nr:hypothetical protein APHAL10511_005128 [Amanita phalloides]
MAERDQEFFIEIIVIHVENRLFKIPQHVLTTNSPVFRNMFDMPIPKDSKPDGCSEEQPLVLEGIKASEFARLLRCIYPLNFRDRSFQLEFSLEEWEEVLKLATFYEMSEVKAFVVEEMAPLFGSDMAVQQVQLSQVYGVTSWLELGLHELVQRAEPLTALDIDAIGSIHAAEVMSLREYLPSKSQAAKDNPDLWWS